MGNEIEGKIKKKVEAQKKNRQKITFVYIGKRKRHKTKII